MKHMLLCLGALWGLLGGQRVAAQLPDRAFDRTMSREVMEAYLSRAITLTGLTTLSWCPYGNCSGYDPAVVDQEIAMLSAANARFLGRTVSLWESEDLVDGTAARAAILIQHINQAYASAGHQPPIVQGAVFEILSPSVNAVEIEDRTAAAFGYTKTTAHQHFDINQMRYQNQSAQDTYWFADNKQTAKVYPDMSSLQTQMWFYQVATKYIQAGCEAIHFGQINKMSLNDPGHQGWWQMLSLVRAYGTANAARHLVLCDAHCIGDDLSASYYDPNWPTVLAPTQPGQSGDRLLLFDFHSTPTRPQEDTSKPWAPTGGGALLRAARYRCDNPYGNSMGGTPVLAASSAGWTPTTSMPYLAEIDNSASLPDAGSGPSGYCAPWKYDEISWYHAQIPMYRDQWLKYAYYKIPALDPNGHFQMPDLRDTFYSADNPPSAGTPRFKPNNMVRRLWDGQYDNDWFMTDIAAASTTNVPGPPAPNSQGNSVSVGDNIYYIGVDGYIYAYNKNGTSWQTTSPSYVAMGKGQNNQMLAAGDLVANPAAQELYYRGTNGQVYGFKILNKWDFDYFKLTPNRDLGDGEKVQSNLMLVDAILLCYISDSGRIYSYVRDTNTNQWSPNSPSWAASGTTPIGSQQQAEGSLVVDPSHKHLYYRGTDKYLHGYTIDSYYTHRYFNLPQNLTSDELVAGGLVCADDKHLYYIGADQRIYGLLLDGKQAQEGTPGFGKWGKLSPSALAALTPVPGLHEQFLATNTSSLAVSPDGKTLVYIGNAGGYGYSLHGYRMLGEYDYEYFNFSGTGVYDWPQAYLRFNTNTELFYNGITYNDANNTPRRKLNVFRLQPQLTPAANPGIYLLERSYNASRPAAPSQALATTPAITSDPNAIAAYPNPAMTTLRVEVNSAAFKATSAELKNLLGQSVEAVKLTSTGPAGLLAGSLSVQDVAAGIYLLVVSDNQGNTRTSRISIQH